jgi:hypothetical protein
MLDQAHVIPYLLERELVGADQVVDGQVTVAESSRRNRSFQVVCDRGASLLVKCGTGPSGRATVAHEARVYRALHGLPAGAGLGQFIQRFYAYDPDRQVLVVELLSPAEDAREYHARRKSFPEAAAAQFGNALSTLHRATALSACAAGFGEFTGRMPWALWVHRPGVEVFRETSNANFQLIRIVQNTPGFGDLLDAARAEWRADRVIHHDIKWENILVRTGPNRRRPTVRLIDWEFGNVGDACWDAGAVLSAYLSFWLFSIPVTGEAPPEKFLDLAEHPLGKMQPAIRAFWRAYVGGMGLDRATAGEWLVRSVKYAAARLLQTGFEHLQKSAEMTGSAVCLIQLSLNLLRRPEEAIAQLLGIPFE